MNQPVPVRDLSGRMDPGLTGLSQDDIVQQLLQQQLWQELLGFQRGQQSGLSYNDLTKLGAPDVPKQAGAKLSALGEAIRPNEPQHRELDRMASLPGEILANSMQFGGDLLQMREPEISGLTDAVTQSLLQNLQSAPATGLSQGFPFNTVGAQNLLPKMASAITEEDAPLNFAESLQIGDVAPGLGAMVGGRKILDLLSDKSSELGYSRIRPPVEGPRISTRFPTAVSATEDPLTENLRIDMEAAQGSPKAISKREPYYGEGDDPGLMQKLATALGDYPQVSPDPSRPYGASIPIGQMLDLNDPSAYMEMMKTESVENLVHLWNKMPPALRERAVMWYDGANRLANEFSTRYDIPITATAGAMAALSPQMDWFKNVALAERVIDTVINHSDVPFSDDMYQMARSIFLDKTGKGAPSATAKRENALILDYIRGKSLDDLQSGLPVNLGPEWDGINENRLQGMWIRVFDEIHRDKSYRKVTPEGYFHEGAGGVSPDDISWGSNNDIGKAASVIYNPDIDNVSKMMGGAHKVRNFYNNIVAPNSDFGDVTIDTHQVGANLFMPVSSSSKPVPDNLQGPPTDTAAGVVGTYPWHAGVVRDAAKKVGLKGPGSARRMQSESWEMIRSLLSPEFKRSYEGKTANPAVTAKVNAIYKLRQEGKISGEEMRERLESLPEIGGYSPLSWEKVSPEGRDLTKGASVNLPRALSRAALSPEERSLNLAKWAKESRAPQLLEEDGSPKRLYHGTKDDIGEGGFELGHENQKDAGWLGQGIYLTDNPDVAHTYSMTKRGGNPYGDREGTVVDSNVMGVYARLKNPYYATLEDKLRVQAEIQKRGPQASKEFSDKLKAEGYDGVILDFSQYEEGLIDHPFRPGVKVNLGSHGMNVEYVIFDPDNIKSATGNRGTYSEGGGWLKAAVPVTAGGAAAAQVSDD